jgi:hypothetical protein
MAVEQHKTFYWSTGQGCLVETIPVWESDWNNRTEQTADSLFRMGAWLMANYDEKLEGTDEPAFASMESCYDTGKIKRWPGHDGKDTSRDQVIMLVASFTHCYNDDFAAFVASQIPYRISKRYFCTPSLWLWLKHIQHRNYASLLIFLIVFYLEIIPALLWTVIVAIICGVKPQYNEVEATGNFTPKLQKLPGWKRLLVRSMYPSFALFLTAMQFYSIGKTSRLLAWYTRWRAPYNNVVRRMYGDDTAQPFADGGPCMNDFWPHRHFDISNDVDLRTVEQADNLGVQFHNSIFKR